MGLKCDASLKQNDNKNNILFKYAPLFLHNCELVRKGLFLIILRLNPRGIFQRCLTVTPHRTSSIAGVYYGTEWVLV